MNIGSLTMVQNSYITFPETFPLPPPSSQINPILVHTTRGSLVENRHRGSYVVTDQSGDIIMGAGHFREVVYARSSLKPINALAMIASGAADHFEVTDAEIALACASHNGEEEHV